MEIIAVHFSVEGLPVIFYRLPGALSACVNFSIRKTTWNLAHPPYTQLFTFVAVGSNCDFDSLVTHYLVFL